MVFFCPVEKSIPKEFYSIFVHFEINGDWKCMIRNVGVKRS